MVSASSSTFIYSSWYLDRICFVSTRYPAVIQLDWDTSPGLDTVSAFLIRCAIRYPDTGICAGYPDTVSIMGVSAFGIYRYPARIRAVSRYDTIPSRFVSVMYPCVSNYGIRRAGIQMSGHEILQTQIAEKYVGGNQKCINVVSKYGYIYFPVLDFHHQIRLDSSGYQRWYETWIFDF